jgi:hypothetical protein
VKVVTPVTPGSSFWFWLYVVTPLTTVSAGNFHNDLHALLQVELDAITEPAAYQPVAWYADVPALP